MITNPDHPDHPLHGLANERKAREHQEIKARERCAVCRAVLAETLSRGKPLPPTTELETTR